MKAALRVVENKECKFGSYSFPRPSILPPFTVTNMLLEILYNMLFQLLEMVNI